MSNKIAHRILIALGIVCGLFIVSVMTLLLWIWVVEGDADSYSRAEVINAAVFVQM